MCWILIFISLIFGMLSSSPRNCFAGNSRVLLREISSITLRRGEYTTGRRSSPVPQLECVGGTAYGKYSPKVVQCYNRGWDGQDVQWECKAEMSKDYQFGAIDVTCEGYEYPNDPYVLAGSCGLRYELDYSVHGAKGTLHYPSARQWFKFESIVYFLAILFVLYLLYLMFWANNGVNRSGDGQRFGSGGGGYPPHDGPPPPGWNPPPPYDDTCGGGSAYRDNRGSGSSGPGFFSGLGLGALGGYLWSRNSAYGSEYRYRRPWGSDYTNYASSYDSGYGGAYDDSGPSTSSTGAGGTHTSSGYGGTSRR